ncbi:MAG: N-acetylmuramoyl-L-alanine amidase [Cognaticolwellia sp.]|jgi:N-acetylmuramoyl-L-alanine amidase
MKHFLNIGLLFLACLTSIIGHSQENLKVKAKKGEGIFSLLKKYKLDISDCNKMHFYQLNNLKPEEGLRIDIEYELPIFIHTYNNQSIRSTLGIKDYDEAVKIQNYNNEMTKSKVKKGNYRTDKELWVPYHFIVCPDAESETSVVSGDRIFPLFGKEHQHVPLKSNKLKGKVYYIVAGHGGPDPGAINRAKGRKICEDEYSYDVALRLARNLLEHGAIAYMIIRDENDGIRSGEILNYDKDEVCWKNRAIPLKQKSRLTQRSTVINKLYDYHKQKGYKEQYALMLHIDSRKTSKRIDVFFYHHSSSPAGKKLALHLQKTIKGKYAQYQKDRGYYGSVTSRDLHMLRETKPTSVYVEMGNIKSEADLQRFLKESNRQALASWLFEGLAGFKP